MLCGCEETIAQTSIAEQSGSLQSKWLVLIAPLGYFLVME